MTKDTRKVLKNVRLEADGVVAYMSGKYDPTTKELRVYRFDGDINKLAMMLQNYAIENGIDKVVVPAW